MNSFAHFFFNYFVLSFFVPDVREFLVPIFVFSVIIDLDHVPGLIKYALMGKRRSKLTSRDFVDLYRTPLQEPIGIITIGAILLSLYFLGINSILLPIAFACLFLHWVIDFLTVHTRPFDPYNRNVYNLFFKTKKQRVWGGITLTGLLFVLFLVVFL